MLLHSYFGHYVKNRTQICYNCRSFDNSSVFALFFQRLEFVPGQKLDWRAGGRKYVLTADLLTIVPYLHCLSGTRAKT